MSKALRYALGAGLLAAALLAGCQDDYEKGYEAGLSEGYETGYARGAEIGAMATAVRYEGGWGLVGLAVGFLVGVLLILLFTRRYVLSEWGKWSRRRQVSALLSQCGVDLDPDLHERLMRLGVRKRKLAAELSRSDGKLVEMVYDRVRLDLRQMDDSIVQLGGLLQHLRDIHAEAPLDVALLEQRIGDLERQRASASVEDDAAVIEEAVEVERRRLDAARKNAANRRRCELKLDMLEGFLDDLTITAGNLRTIEQQEAFEQFENKVSREVSELGAVFERALTDLLNGGAAGK